MVFVVFGILGVNRTHRKDNHVIGDMVCDILVNPNPNPFFWDPYTQFYLLSLFSVSEIMDWGGLWATEAGGFWVGRIVIALHADQGGLWVICKDRLALLVNTMEIAAPLH